MSTLVVLPEDIEDDVYLVDVDVGRVDEGVQFVELVPYLFAEDGFGGDGESLSADEVGLALIAEVGIVLQEGLELPLLGLELPVLILEHTNSPSRVDDQHLNTPPRTLRSPSSRDPN